MVSQMVSDVACRWSTIENSPSSSVTSAIVARRGTFCNPLMGTSIQDRILFFASALKRVLFIGNLWVSVMAPSYILSSYKSTPIEPWRKFCPSKTICVGSIPLRMYVCLITRNDVAILLNFL
ncbi:hypothetical protein CDAR_8611 [Caerostris darwini]|uniref:Uncharacterized protein n=1 Tax=Caerostris darwini TaxID=1538125 RepID=A0AAV4R599_9ARAC|nr:hypothetical protein CDAR_8611 [Caerostris darwini]